MTPPLKKLVIFGLAAGIGKMVTSQADQMGMDETQKDLVIWNAEQIARAGDAAIDKCHVRVDASRMRQAHKKIDQVCKDGGEFDLVEALSFLFLGLNDLFIFCKDKAIIKAIEDAALNFATIYDPNLEDESIHRAAMKKYEDWLA